MPSVYSPVRRPPVAASGAMRCACSCRLSELYTLEHMVETTLSAATAVTLLYKLAHNPDDTSFAGWLWVFSPWYLGHVVCAMIDVFVAVKWYRQGIDPANPINRCLRCRGLCESLYQLLQHVGLFATTACLPYYIAGAISRGLVGDGSGHAVTEWSHDDRGQLGTRINEGAPLSISTIMIPLWLAWVGEECLSVYYDAKRPTAPPIANEILRLQLTSILKSIKIRPRGSTFIFNLQVTLVARMIDGAYNTSWATIFIFVWISVAFVAISLSCLGAAFLMSLCVEHVREATRAYRSMLCGNARAFCAALCVITPVFANFCFYLLLAKRLDGDASISTTAILAPFIVSQLGTLAMLAFSGEQTLINAGDSNQPRATHVQFMLSTEDDAARQLIEQWEREKADYADAAPTVLLRNAGTTFYRSGPRRGGGGGGGGGDTDDSRGSAEEAALVGDSLDDAARASASKAPPASIPGMISPSSGEEETTGFSSCEVCFDAVGDTALLPCGHGGVCYDCATRLVAVAPHQCHLCRQRVLKVSRLKLDHFDEEGGILHFSVLPGDTGTAADSQQNQDVDGASKGEKHAGGAEPSP
jgi:hypothetical protein